MDSTNNIENFYKGIDKWLEDKKTRNLNEIEKTKIYLLNLPNQLNTKYNEHLNSIVPLRISSLETSIYQLTHAKLAVKQFLNSSDSKEASTFFHCANELNALDKFFWKQLRKLDKEIATNERLINTNPYPKVFTGNDEKPFKVCDELFTRSKKNHAFLSFMYRKMIEDELIDCKPADFTNWLIKHYDIAIQLKTKNVASTKKVDRSQTYLDVKELIYKKLN